MTRDLRALLSLLAITILAAGPLQAAIISGGGGGGMATDAIWTTKGDLAVATGNMTAARLGVTPTAGNILVKDSVASMGMAWVPPQYNAYLPTGAIAETFPRQFISNTLKPVTTQRMSMTAIYLPKNVTITSISFTTTGIAINTPVNQWFALYDSSRNLLRQTTNDGATAWATYTAKTLNLTSTYTTTAAGMYYLGIMLQATGMPNQDVISNASADMAGAVTQAPVLCGLTSDVSLTTTAPNPAGAISVTGGIQAVYAYVS